MIIGIGIDAVELHRIEDIIDNNPKFITRVLTENEHNMFKNLKKKRQVEFLGGRFACKEAFSKAYGTGIGKVGFQDIEVLAEESGQPIVHQSIFNGRVHVSITHTDKEAFAQIILEQ
ncbi:holo-ACP synthase [Vagococcus bubulae]|uniref:Holo-[acyl-carrier-protein] synthase n=1 Tax=Vagococcus bubulae TaxID=1977868 RepID=A0A429ZK83_9ENTE|nr:holo-ACP synthase [Vagococcus bubulae]RST94120.1 holo-ACP synthase [Vagococcus bubulae]